MRVKIILVILLLTTALASSYYYYKYNYISTLMLSEIVGETDNMFANLAINIFDFDTGLTRHDIKQLNDKKDYWITRINELEEIQDADQKQQATIQLFADFFDEPAIKKIKSKLIALSPDTILELIKTIFQN